jgi:hypothetical protein
MKMLLMTDLEGVVGDCSRIKRAQPILPACQEAPDRLSQRGREGLEAGG